MRSARDYQVAALDGGDSRGRGAFAEWRDHTATLINIPTGAGKTFVAAEVIKRQLGRTMFMVHLRTIVLQAAKELRDMTGLRVGTEMGQRSASSLDPQEIVVASVQTLGSGTRLEKFDPFDFTLLICDEAHHSISPSWQKVIAYFCQNPNLKVLHLTATAHRGDKKKLAHFESVAYTYSLRDAISEGWLVKPFQRVIEVPGLDLSKVRKMGQDLNQTELAEAMEKVAVLSAHRSLEAIFGLLPHELEMIPEEQWREYIGDRKPRRTLAFCVGVLHAKMVATALNSVYPGLCGFVDGETDDAERITLFERFKNGNLYCLSNCGVTLEGYDNPNIEVILMLRPTRSLPLFLQAIGRGTRALKGTLDGLETKEERIAAIAASGKKNIEIVDFTGNSGSLKLISLIDVFGEQIQPHIQREIKKRAKERALDVEEEAKIIVEENRKLALHSTDFREHEIDGFTGRKKRKKLSKEERAARGNKPISEKWLAYMTQQGLHPERRTEEENRMILKKIKHRRAAGLCTFKQGFTLTKFGYTKEQVERMTFTAASHAIDAIASNGWRRPVVIPEQSFTERLIHETAADYGLPAF